MGLIRWLLGVFGWGASDPSASQSVATANRVTEERHGPVARNHDPATATTTVATKPATIDNSVESGRLTGRVRLVPTNRPPTSGQPLSYVETQGAAPYRYARYGSQTGHYLDLSRDCDNARLGQLGLPVFHNPEQLADWIGLPLNKIAWLVHRFSSGRPLTEEEAHYHFHWVKKRRGGWRLIEAPKATLKLVQSKILHEILNKIPVHSASHGFAVGRSILTNATPHVGQGIIVKFDLSNFYPTVSFARVVAIFRSFGYSREAAIWLGLLTTSAIPGNLAFQEQGPYAIAPYLRRHLPQGAPTSPALANLSAYGLDVRLAGLARSFGANFTRYADDMTSSGPAELGHGLSILVPLVQQIVRQERFSINKAKRKVLRSHQRQVVTGVVVNEKPNVSRAHYDRLKATLTNCLRHGPSTQNHERIENFCEHLRGCIAYVAMLNPARGKKLSDLLLKIDWNR